MTRPISFRGLNTASRGTALEDRDQTIAVSEVARLSSRVANEARFQFTRGRLAAPANDLVGPAINISGVANLGTSTSSPTGRDIDLYELVDNVTVERGAHSLKFGADFLYNRVNINFPGATRGVYTFSPSGSGANQVSALTNFRNGRYSVFQQATGSPSQFQSNPNFGVFAQDEWRIRPSLTVNAGLRYDLQWLPDPIETDANRAAPRAGLGAGQPQDGCPRGLRRLLRAHPASRDLERAAARRLEIPRRPVPIRSGGRARLPERGRVVPGGLSTERHDD